KNGARGRTVDASAPFDACGIKGGDKALRRGNDCAMVVPAKQLRVLVSEGSSTSAREAITILGLAGHHAEGWDPWRWCLSRYSRFLRRFHRCPGLRTDPAGFLRFIERLLTVQPFDVLLPTHEQGFVFARAAERLAGRAGLALP